jgi:hypothetical protein
VGEARQSAVIGSGQVWKFIAHVRQGQFVVAILKLRWLVSSATKQTHEDGLRPCKNGIERDRRALLG